MLLLFVVVFLRAVQTFPIDGEVNPEELGEYLEGDIVVVNTRNGVLNGSLRWGEGVVPFVIDDAHLRDTKKMIIDAMEQYHKKTCIRSETHTTTTTKKSQRPMCKFVLL